ncbi:MAG: alpha/beta hydrolase domain-containing protein [Ramlibacter sp.]
MRGELSAEQERIPDLRNAVRNPQGKVEYATRVTLIVPAQAAASNGTLLIDIPNRSRATAQALFNGPRALPLPIGQSEPGNGFLQEQGFTVATVYWELSKDVQLPFMQGAGGQPVHIEASAFPVVRDVAAFLARDAADAAGTANPARGLVRRTIGFGYSQSGRFLKSMLLAGETRMAGRPVFDAMFILGAAAGSILLQSHPGAESRAGVLPTFGDPELRGVHELPAVSVADLMAGVRERGEEPPKMLFLNTTTDYFSLRASLGRTGVEGREQPLPANVRMYDVAGGSHVHIAGKSPCSLPYARLDWRPVLRATLVMLQRWTAENIQPPANELMPLEAARADDPLVLPAPRHLPGAVMKVPVRDADGIAVGGVRLPDAEVPLGTNAVQNPPMNFICSLAAGFSEFKRTSAERAAAADQRASLAERYKGREDYAGKVRAAAIALEQRGFLLPADTAVIVDDAYSVDIPAAR